MDKLKYWVGLSHFPKFGPVRLKKIKKYFAEYEHAFNASSSELEKAGIEKNIAEEFVSARISINPDELAERLNKENIKIITVDDANYPKLLLEIYNPPQIIYYKGELESGNELSLAVVGSRKYTGYGKRAAEEITGDLAKNNLTIVSGLALGIDAIAHSAAVEARGKTIAVLGSGIDKESIYPSANRYLAEKIAESGGAIISEFPLGTQPLRYNFPQRNRIIAGISLGVLVVEAGEKSGALITANCALEQNRDVFAVPGSIYSETSKGPNKLIELGAKPVKNAADIMEALDLNQVSAYIDNKKIIPESAEEEKILSCLTREPEHINELVRKTELNTSIINSALAMMEMKGMVKNLGGMQYIIV
ncbi:DNA-processing protein DprA [Patescibacteria group bacterium]|nr:DNA-processing protein DprA [Patescibacteria group bacterium]MBU4600607.1 DNA-processing protein DprA [Patescibacteria group bacterium]